MIKNPAAKRYATALFELARHNQQENDVNRQLQNVKDIIQNSNELKKFIKSPTFPPKQKINAIKEIIKKIKCQKIVENFILVITKNRRLNIIEDIINAYQNQIIRQKNQINAEIITANKIKQKNIDEISKIIEKNTNKKPVIKTNINPEIIGGIIVRVGSQMFDNSIQTKLQKLKNNMEDI